MKNLPLLIFMALLLFASCRDSTPAKEIKETANTEQKVEQLDTLINEIDAVAEEIEMNRKALENALLELE